MNWRDLIEESFALWAIATVTAGVAVGILIGGITVVVWRSF